MARKSASAGSSGAQAKPRGRLKAAPASAKDKELMMADLARSGIDERSVKRLKLQPLSAVATEKISGGRHKVPAYKIPYLDMEGEDTGFFRLRFLAETKLDGKVVRYLQPANTEPRTYFAPGVAWEVILSDVREELWVTEGEKKAAAACLAGLPTLGLGGVWSWRSNRFGHALLPDLEAIQWQGRKVVIVFDSDLTSNPKVQGALSALGRTLLSRGAVVVMMSLPSDADGNKQGLDDALVNLGKDGVLDLPQEALRDTEALWRLNEEVALVRDSAAVVEMRTGNVYTANAFSSTVYANRRFIRVTADGKLKEVSAASEWLKWPHRREHPTMTYEPGNPPVLANGALNLWHGWGAEPAKGDVSLWYELLHHVFEGMDPAHVRWFLQWCAYPIQHPGTKLYSSVLLHGTAHGTGKSFIGYLLGACYGDNFKAINQETLQGAFNSWAKCKQFVMGEELTGSDKRTEMNNLKFMITREQLTVNEKYQPAYDLPDCINYLLTANEVDALFLENKDRRLFVHEVLVDPAPQSLYDKLDRWLRSGQAAKALLYHLMHEVDLKGFHPRAPAPMTAAKRALQDLSASDLDLWARRLVEDPDTVLAITGARQKGALWQLSELLELADPGGMRRTTQIALAKALRRVGLIGLDPTRTRVGVVKLWAVRNVARWRGATHEERVAEYESHLPGAAKKTTKRRKKA
jgi:hypothetical protein